MAMGNTCATPGTPGQAKKKMPPAPDPYELDGDSTLVKGDFCSMIWGRCCKTMAPEGSAEKLEE